MAGILAVGRARAERERVERMVAVLRHRGPDDEGLFVDDDVVLGHARLSILDLTTAAAQPMQSRDGRWVLSFNGEIFNFQSLRRTLSLSADELGSTGDTVVLLEHVAEFGVEATLQQLEGDWVIALWDRVERRLLLARDMHGVKPLYYRRDAGVLSFASEAKALLGDVTSVDSTTMNASLMGLSGTWGDRTMFRQIRSLRPGECLEFRGADVEPHASVVRDVTSLADPDLARELASLSETAIVDRLEAAFTASNRLRMISDAPLACLVSGGVDSSLVATMAQRVNPDLQVFHADVVGNSERTAAEHLAATLSLDLHTTTVTDRSFLDHVAAVTYANEVPLVYHANSVPFYLVSRLAHEHGIKVLLTGEGSDEFFIGYPQYALLGMLDTIQRGKMVVRGALENLSARGTRLLWPRVRDQHSEQLRRLLFRYEQETVRARSERAFASFDRVGSDREALMAMDLAQPHLVSLLHRNDRLGMAWSLESRFPFLGYEFNRLAVNLPRNLRLRRVRRFHDRRHPFTVDKWAVRAIAARHVPPALANREKQGFPVSVYERIDVPVGFFRDGFLAEQYGLDARAIEVMVDEASQLWSSRLMFLEVWGRLFARRESVDVTQAHLDRHVGLRS